MISTSTDLINKALGEHLEMPRIDSIDDTSDPVAVEAKAVYDPARLEVLRALEPSFGRKEVALALATGETSVKYDYVYGYPADSLKLAEIWNESTNDSPRIEYEVSRHSSGSSNVILTNKESAVIFHTVDVSNLSLWTSDAIEVFAVLVASKLAASSPIRDIELSLAKKNEYLAALAIARTSNKTDQHKKLPKFSKYEDARIG